MTNTYSEVPPNAGGSVFGSSEGNGWISPVIGAVALGSAFLLPALSSGALSAAQGPSNAGIAEEPVHTDTPAPTNQVEQPKEEHRGGMLAQTGANVLILILIALVLMGLGLLLVLRRRR
ncbi:LPXTG cell wall anchor domain-containing protein [Corynebacterium sp. CCM 9185]|uniref:LPXTG cell wall anchor domain-containing protein n=1 Tax=Corynebacterium marambiense TaxID=2765364 RepID=A0ABS0VWW2_9CORY|nr:LPXTG cell wall anchor domain-containing protein [Corynebacterium marambiense]MBI9001239.1 LPXTG cell wall anchor domain-containing protein [Corynebacterium marambiense]MCK7663795.1 LPXTG cell wall anchor domain-containing protein [Corynebacterium marambiense]MCX7542943.1 LPXTG cell wall anchor domain-containing protein [Corynebacterium marambiense]